MNKLTFRQLTSSDDLAFAQVVAWQFGWWGEEFALNKEQVELYMRHSICQQVPYTYLAYLGEELIGYYQVIPNDLFTRPDLTPWFAFAFIAPKHRGNGYFRQLMAMVPEHARQHGLTHLYLHSRHTGLYEKFGWELLETSDQYKPDGITRRLYQLVI
ncbi:GNAT family N-acetyltransferase [bacterium]|nr:GNAT family N-acetyltransferase [bacterium]MBQ6436738.1 GNAT family N-acetyltransferase [bacterium]